MKLVIADDDPMYRRLLEAQVREWDFEPQIASDGVSALRLLQEDDSPVRLAILDWQMPEMDGTDVCKRIKDDPHQPFTYIILLTGRNTDEDMLEGLQSGADDYLNKPVAPALLHSRLQVARRIAALVESKIKVKPDIPGYEVQEMIGKGAFATVWKGRSLSDSQREVAIKVLPVSLCSEQVFSRFKREIELLNDVDHPNIARIHDSYVDDSYAHYVMDLFDRGSIDQVVRDQKLGGMEIIKLVYKVLSGLHHLHGQGIIHRDLKTSNIMIGADGEPRIVDFGLGKSMFQNAKIDLNMTLGSAIMGTPLFMSPEQARGDHNAVDHRTDIYSVATVLYVLLLKQHPRDIDSAEHDDLDELLNHLSKDAVVEPTDINPKFNLELQTILMKGLANRPEDRYQSAKAFASDLKQWFSARVKSAKSKG